MNIFFIHPDPIQSAIHLVDKHIIKQITESSQMLASALIRYDTPINLLPLTKAGTVVKGGYPKHPSTRWAGNTRDNFEWLTQHAIAMCGEYTARYGKTHFCEGGIRQMANLSHHVPRGTLSRFAVAINEDSVCRKEVDGFSSCCEVVQYRLYYKLDKSHLASWKRNKPRWYDMSINEIMRGL